MSIDTRHAQPQQQTAAAERDGTHATQLAGLRRHRASSAEFMPITVYTVYIQYIIILSLSDGTSDQEPNIIHTDDVQILRGGHP